MVPISHISDSAGSNEVVAAGLGAVFKSREFNAKDKVFGMRHIWIQLWALLLVSFHNYLFSLRCSLHICKIKTMVISTSKDCCKV